MVTLVVAQQVVAGNKYTELYYVFIIIINTIFIQSAVAGNNIHNLFFLLSLSLEYNNETIQIFHDQ